MKRIITLALLLFIAGSATEAYSQSWLKKLGKKVEEKAKQKVEEKVDKTVDKAFDKADEAASDAVKGKDKKDKTADSTGETNGQAGQEGGQQQKGQSLEMTYAKNDFVAGDEIIFEDNLAGEQLGEFPSQWDLIRGTVEVANMNGSNVIFFSSDAMITPLMKNMKNYLPDVFTIEFDYWKFPSGLTQTYHLDLFDGEKRILELGFGTGTLRWAYQTPSNERRSGEEQKVMKTVETDGWNHLSLSFNQRALKVYINGTRIANIPSMMVSKYLQIFGTHWQKDYRAAITNVRIAKGAVPLYDRMMSDGKFITYGITFDVGKSTIKPESMGEINRIVQLMNENPDLKFSVEGHTDATGNAASNQTLSEARSKAIVDKLVEMGIAADRLTSVGKGQNTPIADNSTDEGRAKNRRVEFVKI